MIDFQAWLDVAEDFSMQGLALAIDAGYCAVFVAAVVLVLNVCCRRWLGPTAMSLLWRSCSCDCCCRSLPSRR